MREVRNLGGWLVCIIDEANKIVIIKMKKFETRISFSFDGEFHVTHSIVA